MGEGDQALGGEGGRLGLSLAASRAWEGDKLWILIINAASATPVTGTEGGKGVGRWEVGRKAGRMEKLKGKGKVDSGSSKLLRGCG